MSERPISRLFMSIVTWLDHYGLAPEGPEPPLFEVAGPDGFHISLNRTAEEIQGIPPFSMKLVKNGWPVALLDPYGGVCMGISEQAIIDSFEETVP